MMSKTSNSGFSIDIATLLTVIQGVLLRTGSHPISYQVHTDSRAITKGALFIAINGKKYPPNDMSFGVSGNLDGHVFLHDAHRKGARTFIIDNPMQLCDLYLLTDSYVLLVDDSIKALGQLARWFLMCTQVQVIGVTGSTGKTSTTHAIASCLKARHFYRARTTIVGLAVDILTKLAPTDQFLAVEMQMDGLGQIARLCTVMPSNLAVITSINNTHLQRLGNIENILAAKLEICTGLSPSGMLIINGDDIYLFDWMKKNTTYPQFTYGTYPHFDLYASDICTRGKLGKCSFKINYRNQRYSLNLNLIGKQAIYTGLATAAVCLLSGFHLPEICTNLERVVSIPSRMQLFYGQGKCLVLDDTYNASPISSLAAIEHWKFLDSSKHIAIMGSMLELGPDTEREHRLLGKELSNVANILVTVGQAANIIADEARRSGLSASKIFSVNSVEEAISLIPFFGLDEDTAVLVKGSATMRMERITLHLIATPLT